jgi:hypothetical protein
MALMIGSRCTEHVRWKIKGNKLKGEALDRAAGESLEAALGESNSHNQPPTAFKHSHVTSKALSRHNSEGK